MLRPRRSSWPIQTCTSRTIHLMSSSNDGLDIHSQGILLYYRQRANNRFVKEQPGAIASTTLLFAPIRETRRRAGGRHQKHVWPWWRTVWRVTAGSMARP
eukprot:6176312-Pleurochrysis_carterae.AAC.2